MNSKITSLIESSSKNFSKTDRIISQAIMDNPNIIIHNDIITAANLLFVSKSSITRFCTKIQLPGYKELKYVLTQTDEDDESHFYKFSSVIDFFQSDYLKIIDKIKPTIKEKEIKDTVALINNASKTYIIGIGSSGFLAQEFSYRLQRLGINCQAITDNHFITMHSRISTSNDLFLCISLSGETRLIISALENFKNNNSPTVLLTQVSNSSACNLANIILLTPQKKNLSLTDSISDQFSLVLVTDILFHYLFISNPSKYKTIYDKTIIDNPSSV